MDDYNDITVDGAEPRGVENLLILIGATVGIALAVIVTLMT